MLKKPDNNYEIYNLAIIDKKNNTINYNVPKEGIIKLLQDHNDKIWIPQLSETDYEYYNFGKYLKNMDHAKQDIKYTILKRKKKSIPRI